MMDVRLVEVDADKPEDITDLEVLDKFTGEVATRVAMADADAIDRLASRAMTAFDVPGMAIGVVKDGAVVYARGHGVRELGRDGAIDTDTLFKVASNSKAFTAAALAILVDDMTTIGRYAKGVTTPTFRLLKRVLPGPYTFIFEATPEVPKIMLRKRRTIGVRMPDNPIVLDLLAELGHDPGPIDGLLGRRTASAIRSFQTAEGLSVDGRVEPGLLAALERRAKPAAPVEPQPPAQPGDVPTPLMAGYYDIVDKLRSGGDAEFGDLFVVGLDLLEALGKLGLHAYGLRTLPGKYHRQTHRRLQRLSRRAIIRSCDDLAQKESGMRQRRRARRTG